MNNLKTPGNLPKTLSLRHRQAFIPKALLTNDSGRSSDLLTSGGLPIRRGGQWHRFPEALL
jgi:hypothetical protein